MNHLGSTFSCDVSVQIQMHLSGGCVNDATPTLRLGYMSVQLAPLYVMNHLGSTFLCKTSIWIQTCLSGTGLS
jgi:hypothetical protein